MRQCRFRTQDRRGLPARRPYLGSRLPSSPSPKVQPRSYPIPHSDQHADLCASSFLMPFWVSSYTPLSQVARFSDAYRVCPCLPFHHPLLIFILRSQGDPRWHARRQPYLLPSLLSLPHHTHTPTYNLFRSQTYSYSRHFVSTCVRVCGYESTTATTPRSGGGVMGIDVEGHVTAVMHCPVGVDAERVCRDVSVLFSFVHAIDHMDLRSIGLVLVSSPSSRR